VYSLANERTPKGVVTLRTSRTLPRDPPKNHIVTHPCGPQCPVQYVIPALHEALHHNIGTKNTKRCSSYASTKPQSVGN
jgi:hypothetical protein